MPKQLNYKLNDEQVVGIREAMKSTDVQVAKRATMIHSLHLGYRVEAVAEMQNMSVASVYRQVQHFQTEGLVGLADKPKSGRPRKATAEYIVMLEETLASDPKDKGYAFSMWTQARLRQYLA